MGESTFKLSLVTIVAASALGGCAAPGSELGSATEALETAYTIDFSDLTEGQAVATDRYAAKGVELGTTANPGTLTGYSFGTMTLAVNSVPTFGPATILVVLFHDAGAPGAYTAASQVAFDIFDTESSMIVRAYGDTTGGQLQQTFVINDSSAHITLAGSVGRIEVEDVAGDGFAFDNLGYALESEDAETCASRLEAACPSDGDWKNHGQYVSCVSRVSRTCVDDGLATREERNDFIQVAAHSDIGK